MTSGGKRNPLKVERGTGAGGGRRILMSAVSLLKAVVANATAPPQDLLKMTAADDQQPVKALGTDGSHPPLHICVGVGRLHGCHQHVGALRAEHIVEPTAELRVTIADEEARAASCLVLQAPQEVASLLGDRGWRGVGGDIAGEQPPGDRLG